MPISNQKHLQQFPQFFFEKDGSSVFFISTLTPIIIFLPQKNLRAAIFRYSIKNQSTSIGKLKKMPFVETSFNKHCRHNAKGSLVIEFAWKMFSPRAFMSFHKNIALASCFQSETTFWLLSGQFWERNATKTAFLKTSWLSSNVWSKPLPIKPL